LGGVGGGGGGGVGAGGGKPGPGMDTACGLGKSITSVKTGTWSGGAAEKEEKN